VSLVYSQLHVDQLYMCIYIYIYIHTHTHTHTHTHNITAKAALKFGSEAWVLKKRQEQRLEAAQMKFLRHLLGVTKLDKEKDQSIREKTGAENIVKEIKHYQKKVATTHTEDGHKQDT